MSKTVLYLCPSFPYPADSGGKAVFINHINFFRNNGFKIHAIFLDVDDDALSGNIVNLKNMGFESFNVFSRKIPRINGFSSIIRSLFYFLFNKNPRALIARYNPELQNFLLNSITNVQYDYVIFDHFTSFAFINDFKVLRSCNSIYISHNFEAKVIKDQYKSKNNPLTKLFYVIEYYKTRNIEKNILKKISLTITISSEDNKQLSGFYNNSQIMNIPEIMPLKKKTWEYHNSKSILFVGGTDYYPNYEAVDWIVKVLMPELSKIDNDITCTIVGNTDNYKYKDYCDNVIFPGRINDEEMEQLYCSSNLFISPVILGSGIKVKVLTALSYAMPVLCTQESLNGIDCIKEIINLNFDRNSLDQTANAIIKLLNSENKQVELSELIKQEVSQSFDLINRKWALNDV
jgi:polysaccharide biosynthesis protein PslH